MKRILYILLSALLSGVFAMTGCTVMEPPEPENTDPDTMHVDPPDTVTPGPVYAESTRRLMTEFAIAKTDNPQIDYNIRFTYDSVSRTYKSSTQRWIEGIDSLKPSFVADGEVYLNEMEIQSGTTPCDFRDRIVVFTIKNTEELIQQTCTVSIISPQTTGLPVFKIDIEGGKSVLDKETYLPSAYSIYTHDSKLTGNLGIRGRGNSTWWQNKKPYKIKLTEKRELFGMHKAKTWVLLANALDPTLLTNAVAFELARRMELSAVNHGQHVELFLNKKYNGNYFLTEQIDIHKGRVEADTLQGGFLLELDQYYDRDYRFRTSRLDLPVMLHDPENEAALNEAQSLFRMIETFLASSTPSFKRLERLIDMPSLARYMLMNELVCNIELGHPKSVYCFRKNRDALLEWGPAWDYDWGYGYQGGNYVYFQNPDRMMFDLSRRPVKMDIQPGAGADFFSQFFLMPEFEEIYKQEWERLLPKIRDIDSYVLEQGQQLELSWQEDQKRWSNPPITHKYDYLDMMQYLVKRMDMITEVVGTE